VASMRQALLDFTGGNLIDDMTMLVIRAGRAPKGSASRPALPIDDGSSH
jgi:hypothetical protein